MTTRCQRSKTSLIVVSLLLLVTCASADVVLFVSVTNGNDANAGSITSPFKTLEKAKETVRDLSRTAPITVYLRAGTYYLDSTLIFTPQDGGTAIAPITYSAYKAEKVILSGAKKFSVPASGWTAYPGNANIKVATIAAGLYVDQLFVNGKRQVLARYPNYDSTVQVLDGYASGAACAARIAKWPKPTEEPGYLRGLQVHLWGGSSYIITGITGRDTIPVHDNSGANGINPGYQMVENNLAELDAPA